MFLAIKIFDIRGALPFRSALSRSSFVLYSFPFADSIVRRVKWKLNDDGDVKTRSMSAISFIIGRQRALTLAVGTAATEPGNENERRRRRRRKKREREKGEG